jgi:hypothetical protein
VVRLLLLGYCEGYSDCMSATGLPIARTLVIAVRHQTIIDRVQKEPFALLNCL